MPKKIICCEYIFRWLYKTGDERKCVLFDFGSMQNSFHIAYKKTVFFLSFEWEFPLQSRLNSLFLNWKRFCEKKHTNAHFHSIVCYMQKTHYIHNITREEKIIIYATILSLFESNIINICIESMQCVICAVCNCRFVYNNRQWFIVTLDH